MYDNVEDSGSGQKKGAVSHAIIFAVYIVSLAILAILSVPFGYFFVIAGVGLPATGLFRLIQEELRARRWAKLQANQPAEESIRPQSATDSAGNPVIHL